MAISSDVSGSVAFLSAPRTKRCISPLKAPCRAGNAFGCARLTSQSGSNSRMVWSTLVEIDHQVIEGALVMLDLAGDLAALLDQAG